MTKIREQREKKGYQIVEMAAQLTGYPLDELAVILTMIDASITYLVMLGEFCPVYNGIAISEDAGWEKMSAGIDALIDKIMKV